MKKVPSLEKLTLAVVGPCIAKIIQQLGQKLTDGGHNFVLAQKQITSASHQLRFYHQKMLYHKKRYNQVDKEVSNVINKLDSLMQYDIVLWKMCKKSVDSFMDIAPVRLMVILERYTELRL